MPRRDDGLLVDLTHTPWWMSIIVAGIAFVGMKFLLPAL
jgi:restriction system protein